MVTVYVTNHVDAVSEGFVVHTVTQWLTLEAGEELFKSVHHVLVELLWRQVSLAGLVSAPVKQKPGVQSAEHSKDFSSTNPDTFSLIGANRKESRANMINTK